MKKKVGTLLLALALAATAFAGCTGGNTQSAGSASQAQDQASSTAASSTADSGSTDASTSGDPYAEPLSFTVYSLDDAPNFMDFPLVKEAREKFNIDFKIQQVAWDNWDETTRTLAATDSLPEVLAWYNLNYGEYVNWVNEGVFKPLPDDFSSYPELQKLYDTYSIFDYLKVDGKLYGFPKIKNSNPYNLYDSVLYVYRKDWADAMGKNYEPVQDITYTELIEYLKELKEKDPGQLGDKLVPIDATHGGQSWVDIATQWNPNIRDFKKTDAGYIWGAADPSSLEAILALKDMYSNGLLAKDSYADKNLMGQERFRAGRVGVYRGNLNPSGLMETVTKLSENVPGFTEEDLGVFTVKMNDGKYHVSQMSEWWTAFAFSAKCSDEVMDRWLAVANWMIEEEQVEKYAYGIPAQDWTKDGGKITLNYDLAQTAKGEPKDYIVEQRQFQKFFILEGMEIWLPGNPNVNQYLVQDLFKTCVERWDTAPFYAETDYDVAFLSTPSKDQYGSLSNETKDAVMQAVMSDDPEGTWQNYLDTNKATMDQVVQEINEALS